MKKKWLAIAGILAGLGIMLGLIVYFFVFNKPHTDYSKSKPEFELLASTLFDEFRANPEASATKYNGRVLAISGELNGVEQTDSLTIAVFSFEEGMFGNEGVRCTMIPEHSEEILSIPPATNVTLKGLCTGYNDTDVILEHCSVVK